MSSPAGSAAPSPRLSHARHNLAACELLRATGGYADWVVTTAFYAANHYVRARIFPLTENWLGQSVTDPTFGAYCSRRGLKADHKQMKRLVRRHVGSVASRYDRLLNASWGSRYNDYRVSAAVERTALEDLKEIIAVCDPGGPTVTGV